MCLFVCLFNNSRCNKYLLYKSSLVQIGTKKRYNCHAISPAFFYSENASYCTVIVLGDSMSSAGATGVSPGIFSNNLD